LDESVDKMMSFYCPVAYNPKRRYTREEMIDVILPHQELLCFFAQSAGYARCVLGLDFDDPTDGMVPVFVMESREAKPLLKVHGRRFKQAYRISGPGNTLVVTFTSPSVSGWFKMDWQLDGEQVMHVPLGVAAGRGHNPVIGYLLADETYSVIGPPGESIDPAFYSREDALRAAEVYGRQDDVHEVVALYLEGVMNVVFHDVGDIRVDGRTAQRFVEACDRRGVQIGAGYRRKIDPCVRETIYSCRQLLGE
jgi:hypothetical protein